MGAWVCWKCANEFEGRKKPRRCPECESATLLDADGREKGDDDGREYADPRDALAERRGLA